jgi:GT2 family glycosyltransferase
MNAHSAFPPDLVLTPISRRPTRLNESTVRAVLERPAPTVAARSRLAPQTSIVVVTRDNLVFARLCLESLLAATDGGYEVIAVDNGSTDGTREYLSRLNASGAPVRALLNESNRGFARACNQGLRLARGEVLVLLNDDTVVTPGWLRRLTAHLDDPEVGMVGPTTNRIGNEAEIDASYRTLYELVRFADARAETHAGDVFDIPTLTMFCVAMRRDTYEAVGPLDERFEVGLLEDDDYSLRVRSAGYRLLCADDAFIHHFGETSFGKLVPGGEYARLLHANRRRFEEKWGVAWKPYGRRQSREYRELRERIRRAVADTVPPEATVLVASRGDDELLRLGGRRAWHFPRSEGGGYAGHHPADGEEAIAHLEELRLRGADHLLFPRTGLWWLDHYRELRRHLEVSYHTSFREPGTCVIYALRGAHR